MAVKKSKFDMSSFSKDNEIIIRDDRLPMVYYIKPKRKVNYQICIVIICFFVCVFAVLSVGVVVSFKDNNYVNFNNMEVLSYDDLNKMVMISIEPTSEQEGCSYIYGDSNVDGKLIDNKCHIEVPLDKVDIVFTDESNKKSNKLEVNDYVIDLNEKDIYYLPLKKEIELGKNKIAVGNPVITWTYDANVVEIINNKLRTKKNGVTVIQAISNGKVLKEIKVVVTDTIVDMPNKFNTKKKYLPCNEFTKEENDLLDEILAYRVKEAGYKTRAGAVAAARFLTLEFPYRIAYYWETGRLNNTGKNYVDGEGRYYHKGLYLHKSRIKDIEASLLGPKIWGCTMKCYENDPPYFIPGKKYPNGLDCSGFVSWVMLNAGFDVGDRGAGESKGNYQMTDLGEFTLVTESLIKSGKIKVGDYFNYWGHISIIVGEDDDNYYVAESLNTFGGVVIRTYSKKNVMKTFKYVVLMEDYYKEDGNITKMWNEEE